MTGINSVVLLGTLTDRGVTLRPTHTGTMQASFSLDVLEETATDSTFHLWVTIECYGQALPAAECLEAGDLVAIEGKLKSTSWTDKQGQKQRRLVVLARSVKRVLVPVRPGIC